MKNLSRTKAPASLSPADPASPCVPGMPPGCRADAPSGAPSARILSHPMLAVRLVRRKPCACSCPATECSGWAPPQRWRATMVSEIRALACDMVTLQVSWGAAVSHSKGGQGLCVEGQDHLVIVVFRAWCSWLEAEDRKCTHSRVGQGTGATNLVGS